MIGTQYVLHTTVLNFQQKKGKYKEQLYGLFTTWRPTLSSPLQPQREYIDYNVPTIRNYTCVGNLNSEGVECVCVCVRVYHCMSWQLCVCVCVWCGGSHTSQTVFRCQREHLSDGVTVAVASPECEDSSATDTTPLTHCLSAVMTGVEDV